ncbi:unnamed protein product [Anisakis simplex]|uniref:Apple domain-containing protein n=1 Tax=Anisakis simplex TaxID=6269 RepID=A0A3P6SFK2_ANISI|nr:unnamed protein product [Anisakis simplex]
MCTCFVKYEDRDMPLAVKPYSVVENPYDSSEESCLATCLQNSQCQGVVFGIVGGRDVFTCEFYDKQFNDELNDQLIYEPYVHTYFKKDTKCETQS